eukprot:184534_1
MEETDETMANEVSKRMRLDDDPRERHDSDDGADASTSRSPKCTGVVKFFNNEKGFGFIENDDGSSDVFVHQSDTYCRQGFRSLALNEKLEFDIEIQKDGRNRAINVTGPKGAYCIGNADDRSRPRERRPRGSECYSCGETGHVQRDCPSKKPVTCYNCGEEGHFSRDCREERRGGRTRGHRSHRDDRSRRRRRHRSRSSDSDRSRSRDRRDRRGGRKYRNRDRDHDDRRSRRSRY